MNKINLLSHIIGISISIAIFGIMKDKIQNQIIELSGESFIFEKMMLSQIMLILICTNIAKYLIKKDTYQ